MARLVPRLLTRLTIAAIYDEEEFSRLRKNKN